MKKLIRQFFLVTLSRTDSRLCFTGAGDVQRRKACVTKMTTETNSTALYGWRSPLTADPALISPSPTDVASCDGNKIFLSPLSLEGFHPCTFY